MNEIQFPPVFDHRYYASHYPNVAHLSFEDACRHFLTIGRKRGYMGSPMADRLFFIAWLNSTNFQRILEIGPGVNPSLIGENVSYFDVRKGEEFYAYARSKNVTDVQHLPQIDFYSETGSLKVVNKKFDLVFSSHCIEHVYDVIEHVNEVTDVLTEEGVYCLVIPDKRYCFDHFRNTSSIGDITARHYNKEIGYHPLNVVVDSVLEAHNDSMRHWNRDNGNVNIPPELILEKIEEWRITQGKNPSLHAWVFTDNSFEEIFSLLHRARLTRMRPIRVYNTPQNSNSFCVVMRPET